MSESRVVEPSESMAGERAALLERIAASRRALDAVVAELPPSTLALGDGESWTAGDHLWHLAAWEAALGGFLQGQSWAEGLGIDPSAVPDREDFDAINRLVRERGRGLDVAEVLDAYHDAHRRLLDLLDQLPDETLFVPAADGGASPLDYIAGNTCEHFDEHRAALAAIAAGRA